MKKFLFTAALAMSAFTMSAAGVDWEQIEHWSGHGPNKAALIVQFNDGGANLPENAFVWGFRWEKDATPTGEQMFRTIAGECGDLYMFTQYTGLMGSTLAGIGVCENDEITENLQFDFDGAKEDPSVTFDYFNVNTSMGQTVAPAWDTPQICQDAIDNSVDSHVIEHPINARAYGYAAYDYDWWQLTDPNMQNVYWQAGWYKGYWSYFTGSASETKKLGYSSLGMTSVKLKDNDANAWIYRDITNVNNPQVSDVLEYIHLGVPTGIPESVSSVIAFPQSGVTLKSGETFDAGVVAVWGKPSNSNATYTSSNEKIATVDNNGVVTAVAGGKATITAKSAVDSRFDVTMTVNVNNPVEEIIMNDGTKTVTVEYGEIYAMEVTILPESASNKSYTVKISDTEIATTYNVRKFNPSAQYYEFVTHAVGETDVTFTANDGSGVSSTYHFIVKDRNRDIVEDEYQDGTFWLNEEWYTHSNGSINYITADGEIIYKAFEQQNPWQSFGATACYAITYGDRLYIMSKQPTEAGDPRVGLGQLVVADAHTMTCLANFRDLGEGCGDGRACVGVNPGKVYLGHTTGISILSVDTENDTYELNGQVEGVEPGGSYAGQIGDMVAAGDYVFAVKQSVGLLVIDSTDDILVSTIEDANAAGVVRSADGNVWFAAGKKIYRINPYDIEDIQSYDVPAAITCDWGSWRPTCFIASRKENVLFWACGGWSGRNDLYRWEIGTDMPTAPFFKFSVESPAVANTKEIQYGVIGYDDRSDLLLLASTHGASANYRYNWYHYIDPATAQIVDTKTLKPYYWFPSMPIMPDKYAPEISLDEIRLTVDSAPVVVDLKDYVCDNDHPQAWIKNSLAVENTSNTVAAFELNGTELKVTPLAQGNTTITLAAESNGKTVKKELPVVVDYISGVDREAVVNGSITVSGNNLLCRNLCGEEVTVCDLNGRVVAHFNVMTDEYVYPFDVSAGVYVAKVSAGKTVKLTKK